MQTAAETTKASGKFQKLSAEAPPAAQKMRPVATTHRAKGSVTITQVTALVLLTAHASVTVDVPEYELEVLKEIHGPESVVVKDEREVTCTTNAAVAWQILQNKYKQNVKEVLEVFRNPKSLARQFGLPYQVGDDSKVQFQAAQVKDHAGTLDASITGELDNDPTKVKASSAGSGEGGEAGE